MQSKKILFRPNGLSQDEEESGNITPVYDPLTGRSPSLPRLCPHDPASTHVHPAHVNTTFYDYVTGKHIATIDPDDVLELNKEVDYSEGLKGKPAVREGEDEEEEEEEEDERKSFDDIAIEGNAKYGDIPGLGRGMMIYLIYFPLSMHSLIHKHYLIHFTVKIESTYLTRPLDMPVDTPELQFSDDDFFYWHMINASDDFDQLTKAKMKKLLVLERKYEIEKSISRSYIAEKNEEMFSSEIPLDPYDETDLPKTYRDMHKSFFPTERGLPEEESEEEEDLLFPEQQEVEDSGSDFDEFVEFVSKEEENDLRQITVPHVFEDDEVDEDGRRIRSVTKDMSMNDMEVRKEYLFDADPELMEQFSPLVQRTLSVTNAGKEQLRKYKIAQCLKRFQRFEGDTGSPACTVAAMTENLNAMQEHMQKHKGDKASQRRMELLIIKRKRYMMWFRKQNFNVRVGFASFTVCFSFLDSDR